MALSIGIVGLPNVGKSTTFNALTKEQNAEAANYPFCTIEPNKAIVPLPDSRIDKLAELVSPERVQWATVEFVDIAGLVEGASKGEGLGNQFLGNIRETSAVVHVVRCFDDENIIHINAKPDPRNDVAIINTELIMADIEQIERKLDRLSRQVKGDKKLQPLFDTATRLNEYMNEGNPASGFDERESDAFLTLEEELRLITAKKVIFAANVDEDGLAEDNAYVTQLREIATEQNAELVKLCAKVEEEMAGISEEERMEFLQSMGAEESGLEQVIRKGYDALGLISYFTAGVKEVRAWTIEEGWTAPQAAGVIHTDFERGFIRAEVIAYETFVRHGSESAAKAAGDLSVEGKEYIVQDGDIMHFRFNV
ncbi:MAG: redox-regulated ATPase YchF [Candidatus Hydrogenedentota bacterium]